MSRLDLDPDELGPGIYPWLNSVVVPRPIAWVSTLSESGVHNLAPHSFFTVAGVDPPVVSFTSVGTKDTLTNVLATEQFVVSFCDEPLVEHVNRTGTDYPADADEFEAVGLEKEPSLRVRPARVAESPVAIECVLAGTHEFGSSTVVFGRVVHLAVDERVLRDGRPAIDLLKPIARLGADEWSTIGEVTERKRVPYKDIR